MLLNLFRGICTQPATTLINFVNTLCQKNLPSKSISHLQSVQRERISESDSCDRWWIAYRGAWINDENNAVIFLQAMSEPPLSACRSKRHFLCCTSRMPFVSLFGWTGCRVVNLLLKTICQMFDRFGIMVWLQSPDSYRWHTDFSTLEFLEVLAEA